MTKPDEIFLIFQLILVNCVPYTLETLLCDLGKFLESRAAPLFLPSESTYFHLRPPVYILAKIPVLGNLTHIWIFSLEALTVE